MQKDVLYIVTKHLDKNHSIQLYSDDKEKVMLLYKIFNRVQASSDPTIPFNFSNYKKFHSLNLFLQGFEVTDKDKGFWIMLEPWSSNETLIFEFAKECAKELKLNLDLI